MAVKDSNCSVLSEGDSAVLVDDLKVRSSSIPLKRGTMIRDAHLIVDDEDTTEGGSDKISRLMLKACFLKKA